ncbi:glycosyltransferase family 2 protein [Aquipuribacter nitratireducens]|uniref:Glycosyltransferase family 2 protein n=1 Tax=Aquipuribacter nitratireducens TaxID=650104 RepID=A0ABW0GSJ0_9MICO
MGADVAVVVPTHDRPDLLHRTLRTVAWQTGVDLEVVVVDDGEGGVAERVVDALGDPRFRVVPSPRPHGGPCAARNAGAAATTASWVAYLDDDDLWAPDKLSAQLAAVEQTPGAGWVTAGAVSVDDDLRILSWQAPPPPGMQRRQVATNLIPGGGSGTVVARSVVEEVGGFDEDMRHHGDYEMWVRVSLVAPLAVVDRPVVGYLVHGGGLSRGTANGRAAKAALRPRLERLQAEQGVEGDFDSWDFIWGDLELRSGRRWDAARTYAGLAVRRREPRLIARAAVAAAAPGVLRQRAERWAAAQVPQDVRAEAEVWLARVPSRTPTA